ncbi:MAG: inositol monophosphatase family protein, partial [Planctomycetota bacterium]|nr:inositol monophosphatase family protein [Planctomycetota bacterium]
TKSSRRDLATAADVASERAIVSRLREAFPNHAIEAEEEVCDEGDARKGPRWFVDPLDGTINFVHGLPAYCVSLGFYIDGKPVLSVVHLPRLGETFHAILGRGAYLNGARLHVSQASALSESVLATGFPYRRGELAQDNLSNFSGLFYDIRGIRRMGSAAVDLAFTAAGRLDGFWELHLSSFDVAGGALLVREAGGVVTDAEGGEDWLHGGHIIAAGPKIHQALLGRIAHE